MNIVDGQLDYWPEAFSAEQANSLYHQLAESLCWRSDKITLFGKTYPVPRLQAWYGDKGCDYRYSGLLLEARPWTKELLLIKARCEQLCRSKGLLGDGGYFNGVLVNWYRDGQDTVGWHSDREAALGKQPVIASVSLGGIREFQIRHNKTKEKQKIKLPSGSLLVMSGSFQQHWQHAVPRTRKAVPGRINLSFRILKD